MECVNLISDHAIGEGSGERTDGLGFDIYADILAGAAKAVSGPFTIGIFGEWGTGKTSLLRLIQVRLNHDTNTLPIWFNAWQYEKEDHPIVPLIATIIRELQSKKDFLRKLSIGGKNLIKGLRAIAYGFSIKASANLPGVGGVEATANIKDMLDEIDKIETDPLLDNSLYYDAFEILNKIKLRTGAKIVIIIDDLDRCFPEKAVRLLETIKLVLAQPGFVFILGVARSVIEGYLQYRYKSQYGIEETAGQAYLDKMVQMPFHIPPHDLRMDGFYKMLINQLQDTNKDAFEEILPIIGSACGNNPRTTIRFINNLLVDCAIFDRLTLASNNRIPIGNFAVCRALQLRWPNIYHLLIYSESLCHDVLAWDVKASFQKALKSQDQDVAYVAKQIKTDIHLNALLYSTYGRDWLADDNLRITTSQFLESHKSKEEAERQAEVKGKKRKNADKSPELRKRRSKAIRKLNPPFMQPLTPSVELATIVGKTALPRTEVTKKLWAYIKINHLQNPHDRRIINADEKLKKIFGGKKSVDLFEMTRLINKHLK